MVLRRKYDCACLHMSAINCILVHSVPCLCPRTVETGWVASSGFWMLVKFNEQLKENCLLNLNIINMLHGTNCSWDHCGRLSWPNNVLQGEQDNMLWPDAYVLIFLEGHTESAPIFRLRSTLTPPLPTPTVWWFRPIFCASMNLHIEEFGGKSTIMMAQLPLVPNSLSKENESTWNRLFCSFKKKKKFINMSI